MRVVFFYIIFCILNEFANNLLQSTGNGSYTIIQFNLYTVIEFSFFCWFYYLLFPEGMLIKKITFYVWISFLLFATLDYFIINKNQGFDSFTIGIESIILLILCGYFLFYQVNHTRDMMVYGTFNFWVIVTFLLYVSGTFFLYIMTDSMGDDHRFRVYYAIINLSFNILKNALLCIAMVMKTVPVVSEDSAIFPELGDELVFQKNT